MQLGVMERFSFLRACVWLFLFQCPVSLSADTLPCDRELRKTLESIQSYRRTHNGQYPGARSELRSLELLPPEGGICPETTTEAQGGSAAHAANTSRGANADPGNMYEYELSARVHRERFNAAYLPVGAPPFTRGEMKMELLRRENHEQIPLLRCSGHRASAPAEWAGHLDVRRNLTERGMVYWSDRYWELCWVDQVPLCARDASVLFGMRGPPFYDDCQPGLPDALDLRSWSCGFGDHAWWWDFPMFKIMGAMQTAPDLLALFGTGPAHAQLLGTNEWWLNGLVQVLGGANAALAAKNEAYRWQVFAGQKLALPVHRRIHGAAWLQGTIWEATAGQRVARFVWHYADGTQSESEISYGRDTARFWATPAQRLREIALPEPIWETQEPSGDFGYERQIRLYRQEWANPKPAIEVTALDFIADPNCPAAPFIIAINVMP